MKKWLIILVSSLLSFVLLTTLYIRTSLFTYVVSGQSMQPNLVEGTVGGADQFFYHYTGLHRFDIIVVNMEDNFWIKRLVGKPHNHLFYEEGVLYIDGKKTKEPFLSQDDKMATCFPYYERDASNHLRLKIPNICQAGGVQLGENEYFFMGDNRAESFDSRRFMPPISKQEIVAKAFIRYGVCDSFDFFGSCQKITYYFPRFLEVGR